MTLYQLNFPGWKEIKWRNATLDSPELNLWTTMPAKHVLVKTTLFYAFFSFSLVSPFFFFSESAYEWPLTSLGPFTILIPINKGFNGINVSKWIILKWHGTSLTCLILQKWCDPKCTKTAFNACYAYVCRAKLNLSVGILFAKH